uniref:hypothetical protein n=1 Tax=Acetatifactor sp. TaxID=1872090 RepID=UPI0040577532
MKTWENAAVVELNINATAEGGRNLNDIDNIYTDRNTGDFYASFASGGNASNDDATGGDITVIR